MFHSTGTKSKKHVNLICQWHNQWKTVKRHKIARKSVRKQTEKPIGFQKNYI